MLFRDLRIAVVLVSLFVWGFYSSILKQQRATLSFERATRLRPLISDPSQEACRYQEWESEVMGQSSHTLAVNTERAVNPLNPASTWPLHIWATPFGCWHNKVTGGQILLSSSPTLQVCNPHSACCHIQLAASTQRMLISKNSSNLPTPLSCSHIPHRSR